MIVPIFFKYSVKLTSNNLESIKCKFKEVYEAAELDIHDFFRTAKRFKGNKGKITTLNYDQESSNSSEGICNLFGRHFHNLASPSTTDPSDNRFEQLVCKHIAYIEQNNKDTY